ATRWCRAPLQAAATGARGGRAGGERVARGAHGLRVAGAPYVHSWDSIMLVDEREKVVFSSGLFVQPGRCEPLTRNDRSAVSVQLYRTFYGVPPEAQLSRALDRVEGAAPAVLAPAHGSALTGVLTSYFRAYRGMVA